MAATDNQNTQVPENVSDHFAKFFELWSKANMLTPGSDEQIKAADELKQFEVELNNEDLYARLSDAAVNRAFSEGLFDEQGRLKLETDKEAYNQAIKGMADNFGADLIRAGASIAQTVKGLSDLSNLEMPQQPPLPQDTPELTQALSQAERDAQMIDPRLEEARMRAALMTIGKAKEIATTASAGQAGAYGSLMQRAVNETANEMRKGAFEDQLLKQRSQRMYYDLAGQKALEDRFQYGAAQQQFQNQYNEFNTQRTGATQTALAGFQNMFNTLNSFQGNYDLAQQYKQGARQAQQRLDRLDGQQPTFDARPDQLAGDPSMSITQDAVNIPTPQSSFGLMPQLMDDYTPTNDDLFNVLSMAAQGR